VILAISGAGLWNESNNSWRFSIKTPIFPSLIGGSPRYCTLRNAGAVVGLNTVGPTGPRRSKMAAIKRKDR
jgi:hypothetical protein